MKIKQKGRQLFCKNFDSDFVSISEENNAPYIEYEPQGVKVTNFLYKLQQLDKKIDVNLFQNIEWTWYSSPLCL